MRVAPGLLSGGQDPECDIVELSVANVRAMLRAALPLPNLAADRAVALVIEHLINRTRSRRSRRKCQPYTGHDP
jgi:hypothetical protein